MPKRRERREAEDKSASILNFMSQPKPSEVKQAPKAQTAPQQKPSSGVDELVYNFIKSRGEVSRRDLESWAKLNGLTSAQLFGAIYRLTKSGRVIRKILENDVGYVAR